MRWFFLVALVALGGMAGCAPAAKAPDSSGDADSSSSTNGNSGELKSYTAADLPEIDDRPLPAKDEGRVQFSLPTGWKPLKPNPKFLIAAIPEEGSATKFPRITITAADSPAGNKSLTTSNAAEIAEKLEGQMKKSPIEPCTPLALGDNVWIRHVRAAKAGDGADVAIQSLQTIKSGRLYTVELTVDAKNNPRSSKVPIIYEKPLKESRNFAYAVAAAMKFPKEDGAAPAAEPKPAEEKPAEEKPAEEKSE